MKPSAEPHRTLILVPIIHSQEDMGTFGRQLPASRRAGNQTERRWTEIRSRIQGLQLDWSKVFVYQDGLPDTGSEVVQKILGEVQSPNFDLLRWLSTQGATLVGTESPGLLREEYAHLQAVLLAKDPAAKARARSSYLERSRALLMLRDAYIARRISETLPANGIGILFIGELHRVADRLPGDIVVKKLPAT